MHPGVVGENLVASDRGGLQHKVGPFWDRRPGGGPGPGWLLSRVSPVRKPSLANSSPRGPYGRMTRLILLSTITGTIKLCKIKPRILDFSRSYAVGLSASPVVVDLGGLRRVGRASGEPHRPNSSVGLARGSTHPTPTGMREF